MRAVAVHPRERSLDVVDVPEPRSLGEDGVLARVLEVGVCGTDREIAAFEYGTPPDGEDRLIIGHEALAEVIDVGPQVSAVAPGDLVVPMVRRPCGLPACRPCAAGRQDFCSTDGYRERGIKGCHGYMTELVADGERHMVPVAEELRDVAVLTEPLTIAQKALEQLWTVQRRLPWGPAEDGPNVTAGQRGRGMRAVVLGAGPVGLLGAMALVVEGFHTVVYSRSRPPNDKAALADRIGARYVSTEDVPLGDLAGEVGPADVVYEAVGASRLALGALGVLGPNGVAILTGVPAPVPPSEEDTAALMRRLVLGNQVVLGTVNAGRGSYEAAASSLLVFTRRWPDAVRGLITGRHPLEDAPELLISRSGGAIKDVVALGARG
jgi:glucose 1-dehydrogenase